MAMATEQDRWLALGIDVGTTSVKVVVTDRLDAGAGVLAHQSKDTQANVPCPGARTDDHTDEQDVPKILSAVHSCVSRLPKDLLRQVSSVGVCGQMHGVVLWKSTAVLPAGRPSSANHHLLLELDRDAVSNLYTWQDARCKPEFLESLPRSDSPLSLHTGYGCATLFWLARNAPDELAHYDRAGTIQDLLVWLLVGSPAPAARPVRMSAQNAASWGYFLPESRWDLEALRRGGFPVRLLPEVLAPGRPAGKLHRDWFVPAGAEVGVALGDLQCSVYALLSGQPDTAAAGAAVLNVSTSAQLAYVLEPQPAEGNSESSAAVEHLPYFEDQLLAVAASLNGGNALATLVRSLQHWTLELGFSVPQAKVWERLIALGSDDSSSTTMTVVPTLLGERSAPKQSCSVSGITPDSLRSLGCLFRSLCSGVVKNLHGMMPRAQLESAGISRIVGNGSGLVRNPVLQKEVARWYGLPLEFGHGGDAALGAALAAPPRTTP